MFPEDIKKEAAVRSLEYEEELRQRVLPFWEKNSIDRESGGYFTCLSREGEVFDTDKFMWLQGRQAWTFSMLYNRLEKNLDWLKLSAHGIDFLEKHGRDETGNWYFSLAQSGQPLVQPYNIFSDCFASMAFGQYALASGEDKYATIAQQTFANILQRQNNPKGKYNKAYPGTRQLKNFALPMILCNLSLELEDLLEKEFVEQTIETVIHEVMEVFYDEESGLILENVGLKGELSDSFPGRLLNPGHAIEAMWFIMDLAERKSDKALMELAKDRMLFMLEYGWDKEYGGILYFLDRKGHPTEQLEWDQKLWWVHLESLVALSKAYLFTGDEQCWTWFKKIHEYAWTHFSDPEYGEWFGYLNRQGKPLLTLKGGKWKGCFHVPRGLFQTTQSLEKIASG
ncbi:MAG: AGE family epimerase/isomerase [Bacteroidota bacterium]